MIKVGTDAITPGIPEKPDVVMEDGTEGYADSRTYRSRLEVCLSPCILINKCTLRPVLHVRTQVKGLARPQGKDGESNIWHKYAPKPMGKIARNV